MNPVRGSAQRYLVFAAGALRSGPDLRVYLTRNRSQCRRPMRTPGLFFLCTCDVPLLPQGGAISASAATVSILHCRFSTQRLNGPSGFSRADGAVMNLQHGARVTISHTIFVNNTMFGAGGYSHHNNGGAIYISHSTLSITQSSFVRNKICGSVICGGGYVGRGAAIYANNAQIWISDSSFTKNTIANRHSGSVIYAVTKTRAHGAVASVLNGTYNLHNVSFEDNSPDGLRFDCSKFNLFRGSKNTTVTATFAQLLHDSNCTV